MSLESLMPTINPNLDEISKDNNPLQPLKKKPTPDEIFLQVQETNRQAKIEKKKVKRSITPDPNAIVAPTQKERGAKIEETATQSSNKEDGEDRPKKKKYPHLEKARAVASANRKLKSDAKRLMKEKQKAEKETEKERKREVRKQKNRERALENYHKKKDLKTEIVEEYSPPPAIGAPNGEKAVGIKLPSYVDDYEKFAEYMSKWENSKVKKVVKVDRKSVV